MSVGRLIDRARAAVIRVRGHESSKIDSEDDADGRRGVVENGVSVANGEAVVPRLRFKRHMVTEAQLRVRKEARTRFLEKKAVALLDEDDLEALWNEIAENTVEVDGVLRFGYDMFRTIGDALPSKARCYFRPSVFLKMPRDKFGRISARTFFHYIVRKVSLAQLRISLTCYDEEGAGYLREQDLENYIFEQIDSLPQLRNLEQEFYPYYVFTAVRKFVFFLDPLKKGKIPIKDIVASPILMEFNELRQRQAEEAEHLMNDWPWFTGRAAMRLYGSYLQLDVDHNGMLSRDELMRYNGGSLTPVFVDRLFQECRMYQSDQGNVEMDYKTYLDFVLAMQHKDTPEGLRYLFRVLDIDHCGYLTLFTINYFFKAVCEKMISLGHEPVRIEDVSNEIFDMVHPKDPYRITLQDLIDSHVGHTIVGMLIDVHCFWQYDNREALIARDEHAET